MGDSHFARCLQGGGVYIYISMVSFSSCTITGNTATYVRAHAQKFPSPRWEIADALAPTHACTTANASVNYRMYVLQRPCKLPIAPMGNADALALILACTTATDTSINYRMCVPQRPAISHRPYGKMPCPKGRLTFCSLFAGRRCLCHWRLSDL